MTVNRTTLLDLPLPVSGTESGTWGDTTNNGLTQYMDIAIAGMSNLTSANFTAGALTIETTEGDSSATNISATSAQYAGFRVTSLATNSTITVGNTGTSPARSYRLINADATYSLTFKATGQTGVTLLPGQSALVAFNGTDYVIVGVVGAGSTTDNTVPRFDGTTGEILQSSGITIDDSNNVSGVGVLNATTLDATNIEVTNIKAKDGTAAASIADSTGKITVSTELAVDNLNLSGNTLSSTDTNGNIEVAPNGNGSVVITNAGTSNALRITQTGSGNALVVEDSANPDSSPFVVDANGIVIAGNTAAVSAYGFNNQFQVLSTTNAYQLNAAFRNDAFSSFLTLAHSRNTSIGGHTVLQNGDDTGTLAFAGSDGTQFIRTAQIYSAVDGTPGTNDMPGRLIFSTTADGASSPTERMRIDSSGNVGIGGTASAFTRLQVTGTLPSSGNASYGISSSGTIPSTTTSSYVGFDSAPSTAVGSFTLTSLNHFFAYQGTIGAGSTVTNQYGFNVSSSLTGATNNFGFFSNIASGTGRWNFYANGTASNFFGGNTIISVADNTNAALRITQTGTGDAILVEDSANPDSSPFVVDASGSVIQGATTVPSGMVGPAFAIVGSTAYGPQFQIRNKVADVSGSYFIQSKDRAGAVVVSGDALGNLQWNGYDGANYIASARLSAEVDGTPGTNDMPGRLTFSTTADGASSPTERMRIDNAGNVGIGLTPVANNGILQLNSYASVQAMMEKATVSATAATGTINFDAATQPVLYYTTNSSGNWTINIRGSASLSLNSMMQTGQSLTLAFLATNGSTAYYQSALTIDGSSVTPKWQGGTAPTAGNASSIDAYVLTVIKTGSATFTVLASQTKFA